MINAKKNAGFTLLELVMVIVIIGVLSIIVAPKYINLRGEASTASTANAAGGVSSASTINYAARKASNGTKGVPFNFATPCTIANLNTLLSIPIDPAIYTISDSGTPVDCSNPSNDGVAGSCTITPTSGTAAVATYICTP